MPVFGEESRKSNKYTQRAKVFHSLLRIVPHPFVEFALRKLKDYEQLRKTKKSNKSIFLIADYSSIYVKIDKLLEQSSVLME